MFKIFEYKDKQYFFNLSQFFGMFAFIFLLPLIFIETPNGLNFIEHIQQMIKNTTWIGWGMVVFFIFILVRANITKETK